MIFLLCLGALAVAFVAACVIAYCMYRASPGHRWAAIAAWNAPDTPIVCADCNGLGVVDFGRRPIGESPGEIAHMVWAGGNNRTCSNCLGRGFARSPWPRPLPPVTEQHEE